MTKALIDFTLQLADSNLLLAQRNSEWCAHGPILEQDIAITNISLDLLGQARNFYQYAAEIMNSQKASEASKVLPLGEDLGGASEDSLAYHRTEREFKNLLIYELPNIDWAQTILRQFFYSVFQFELYSVLQQGSDAQLAAIAAKSIKETTYHIKWSKEWVLRLGDGTEESHARMQKALENLWPYTGEFFMPVDYEMDAGVEVSGLKNKWVEKVNEVLTESTLKIPADSFMHSGGKKGIHTEHLGFILAEMQYLQRTYPGATW